MSTSTNVTCPGGSGPPPDVQAKIPSELYAAIPGQNKSASWMVACCDSKPVHIVDSCWLWCDLPDKYKDLEASKRSAEFGQCLTANQRDLELSRSLVVNDAVSPPAPVRIWPLLTGLFVIHGLV